MTINLRVTHTRDDADTPWFPDVDNADRTAWCTYKKETWVDTNKISVPSKTLSGNELTLQVDWTIEDRDTLTAYDNASTVQARRAAQQTYEDANGITRTRAITDN